MLNMVENLGLENEKKPIINNTNIESDTEILNNPIKKINSNNNKTYSDEIIKSKDEKNDQNDQNIQFIKISLDPNQSSLENVEVLSNHYKIPNILIKSLFNLNNKHKKPFNNNENITETGNGTRISDVCKFILNLENEIIEFIKKSSVDSWKMKPLNSYYRLLSHQLADYYHLGHILSNDGSSMVLFKMNTSLINADDETKKYAKFDQSGNIRPLDFRNLKFDPKEKLDRIRLNDLYNSYKDFFDEIQDFDIINNVSNDEIDNNINNFKQLQLSDSNNNINNNINVNKNIRIMQRKSNNNEEIINNHSESRDISSSLSHKTSEEILLSKEERYKLVKERIDREQGDDNDLDSLSDQNFINGNDNTNNNNYRKNIKNNFNNNTNNNINNNNFNYNYTTQNKFNKPRKYNNYRYQQQYVYYPNNQMYPPPNTLNQPILASSPNSSYTYVLAPPNSSSNIGVNMIPTPIGSPNSPNSHMMNSPPYYIIPVVPPVENNGVVSKNQNQNQSQKDNELNEKDDNPIKNNDEINELYENVDISEISPVSSSSSTPQEQAIDNINAVYDESNNSNMIPEQQQNYSPNMPVIPVVSSQVPNPMYQYYYPMGSNQYYGSSPIQSQAPVSSNNPNVPTSNGMYIPVMYYGDETNYSDNRNNYNYNYNNKGRKFYNGNNNYNNISNTNNINNNNRKTLKNNRRKNVNYNNNNSNYGYGYGYGNGHSNPGYSYSNASNSNKYTANEEASKDDNNNNNNNKIVNGNSNIDSQ